MSGKGVPVARDQPHACRVAANHQPKAGVLDLVNTALGRLGFPA
jgi:hypothetical protein